MLPQVIQNSHIVCKFLTALTETWKKPAKLVKLFPQNSSLPKSALSISKSRIFSIDCTWQEILSTSFEHQNILERVTKSPMYDLRSSAAQFSLLRLTLWLDVVQYSNPDQMAIANWRHIFAFHLSLTHHCVERLQGSKEMQRKPRNMQKRRKSI